MKTLIFAFLVIGTALFATEVDTSTQAVAKENKDNKEFTMYCSLCKREVMVPHHCPKAKKH